MSPSRGLLRRHGLTLLLTAVLVYVFVTATLPAVRERDRMRSQRKQLEAQLQERSELLRQNELWIRGALQDPFLRSRIQDARSFSPDLPGPRSVEAPPESDVPGTTTDPGPRSVSASPDGQGDGQDG